MRLNKTPDEINQAEWGNSENWSTIYFSKKDSRAWVPKRNPGNGVTVNFGSRIGSRWIYYFFLIFSILGGLLGTLGTFIVMAVI